MHCVRQTISIALLVLTATIGSGCTSSAKVATPETAIESFYAQRIASGVEGTPSIEQLEQLAPFISNELRDLLEAALLQHHKISSRSVQRKRTFAEGDLFSSLFDGPTSFLIMETSAGPAGSHIVTVQLTAAKQLPALRWTDCVKVIRENGRFVVADIEYGNHWAFGNNTSLIASLNAAMGKRARKGA